MSDITTKKPQTKPTPLMAQYLSIRAQYKDYLLLFRMGDFYEFFFEDAPLAAQVLDIALTKRGQHLGKDIPMCGIPAHACDNYLHKLVAAGHKVAVCEQTGEAEESGTAGGGKKTVMKREVVRLITAGTLTEEGLLSARSSNYLLAMRPEKDNYILAWIDISTAQIACSLVGKADLSGHLQRLQPAEILLPESWRAEPDNLPEGIKHNKAMRSFRPDQEFNTKDCDSFLAELYDVKSFDVFGAFDKQHKQVLVALLRYVQITQMGMLPPLQPPRTEQKSSFLGLDMATRLNLEIDKTLSGGRKSSLLDVIDRTVTAAGGRLLAQHLLAPLADIVLLQKRQDAITFFVQNKDILEVVRGLLRHIGDIERALSRLVMQRGSPRDLAVLRDSLMQASHIVQGLQDKSDTMPVALQQWVQGLKYRFAFLPQLRKALVPEPPAQLKQGYFIADGFDPPLDELRSIKQNGRRFLLKLEAEYRQVSAVQNLKIKHNNILGYHIEVGASHADRLMLNGGHDGLFRHRQTMANSVRFSTAALFELEHKMNTADSQVQQREMTLFNHFIDQIAVDLQPLQLLARMLAELDVAAALAVQAIDYNWVKPELSADMQLDIQGGRHPIVEHLMKKACKGQFIPNNCCFTDSHGKDKRIWLVTGPNMAGKSTFLRQNALIILLAQMGSYVPARQARIGCFDRIFSRVGAADNIASGHSTFMVEMMETATILHQATERSFVILDELGRGTATCDGMAIAWATIDYICEHKKAWTMFATHYHELATLTADYQDVGYLTVKLREDGQNIIFLYQVVEGVADRSYGLHVARLAGLPPAVLKLARQYLEILEAQYRPDSQMISDSAQRQLFHTEDVTPETTPHPVIDQLRQLDLSNLTPKQALDKLYTLQEAV